MKLKISEQLQKVIKRDLDLDVILPESINRGYWGKNEDAGGITRWIARTVDSSLMLESPCSMTLCVKKGVYIFSTPTIELLPNLLCMLNLEPKPFRKPFDPQSYEIYDPIGTKLAKEVIKDLYGISSSKNKREKAIDILLWDNQTLIGYCETEVRTHYTKEGKFKYSTYNVPFRKQRYFQNPKLPTILLGFSKYENAGLLIQSEDIIASEVIIVSKPYNHYHKDSDKTYLVHEYFYSVPIEKCTKLLKRHRKWKAVKPRS